MDWPHDPDGEEGSEGGRKYGMAILAKMVDEDDDFPLRFDDFAEKHGDEPVRIYWERVVAVDDILEYVEEDEVEDIVAFHQAIGRAMRRGGFWDYLPEGANAQAEHA
jgi:hypothetical protein